MKTEETKRKGGEGKIDWWCRDCMNNYPAPKIEDFISWESNASRWKENQP